MQISAPAPSTRWLEALRLGDVRLGVVVLGAILTLAIFVADLLTPLGIAGGVPYIAPVFLAIWLPDRRLILAVAAVCSALTIAGLWLSPPGPDLATVITNRLLAVGAIWTVALLSFQRKRFEGALSESEATNRAILASTADGVLTVDSDGRIATANPAAARIFDRAPVALRGQSLSDLIDDEGRIAQRGLDWLCGPDEAATRTACEVTVVRPDGTPLPVEVVVVPLAADDGPRYTVTMRDVSERRVLEQHLLRTSEAERRAIGHTLHEELGQSLTGLSLICRQLARRLEDDQPAAARDLSELAHLLQDVDAQAKSLFQSVVPVGTNGQLVRAIEQLVERAAERYGIAFSIEDDGMVPPEDEVAAAQLYYVVEDLINSALGEGMASAVQLETGSDGDTSTITVRLTTRRWLRDRDAALRWLAYRARLVGGRLEARVEAPDQVVVSCSWTNPTAAVEVA